MRSPLRLLVLTIGAVLLWGGSAQAVIQDLPEFTLSPHTKAQAGAGNAVTMTLTWVPPKFLDGAPPANKQVIAVTDLTAGGTQTFSAGDTTSSSPLLLTDGHRYRITVAACQTPTCDLTSTVTTAQTSGETIIDATPPSGAVQINGGAAATNNRTVALNLTATDPLIGGVAGTSSGVTQQQVDVDGDGTYPCTFFIVLPGVVSDSSGCAGTFAPSVPATLTAGDGVKTVGVKFGDGARVNTFPCRAPFCSILLGSPTLGNESVAAATDTIILDTVKPVAIASQDRFTVATGGSVAFDASGSLDAGTATAASGIDPAGATWSFKDGTASVTGTKVSHAFARSGTFVGELRVRDRAGNLSDIRSFSVTVDAGPAAAGGGAITRVGGTAAFKIDRLRVRARFVRTRFARARLAGSIVITGRATRAGGLKVQLRRTLRGKVIRSIRVRNLRVGRFTRTIPLPTTLRPGTYKLSFIGPGGTLRATLKLKAPRS